VKRLLNASARMHRKKGSARGKERDDDLNRGGKKAVKTGGKDAQVLDLELAYITDQRKNRRSNEIQIGIYQRKTAN